LASIPVKGASAFCNMTHELKLDRLLWIPEAAADVEKLKSELTIHTETYRGASATLELYEHPGEVIGVPRMWGLDQFKNDPTVHVVDNTSYPHIEWPEPKCDWRKGQLPAVTELVASFNPIDNVYGARLEAACGFGKTLVGLAVASLLHTPTLILVHKEDLAGQWHKTAEDLIPGARGGHVQANKWRYQDCHFVTAMAQTLYSRRLELPLDFARHFGLVIYDEGHRYPAKTFERVMRIPEARYRLAVSATWRRKDGCECIWHWHVGDIQHRANAETLSGEYVQVLWKTNVRDSMFRFGRKINTARYINSISKNAKFNAWLAEQAVAGVKAGRRVLLVSDRLDQLEWIRARILKDGESLTIGRYTGKIPNGKKGRRPTETELKEAASCDLILATYGMMAEGTDIPELDTLIFGTPRADVQQVVGRIQRPVDKKRLLIVDPVFSTPYNQNLATKREKTYQKLDFVPQIKERRK